MNNNKILLSLLASTLLVACGSDSGSSGVDLPTPPNGFGSDNDISLVSYNEQAFSQDSCSSADNSFSRRHELRFYDTNKVDMKVRAFGSANCLGAIELVEYQGQFEIKGESTLSNGDSAVQVEMIFTQAWSTLFDQARVDTRNGPENGGSVCDRKDWAVNKRIDISNYNSCFPLFAISERQQFRLIRKEQFQGQNALFIDNPEFVPFGSQYSNRLDSSPLTQGEL